MLPNTDVGVRWRQHFVSRISNVVYSTSSARYPLCKKLAKILTKSCGHPCRNTTDVSGPAATKIFPRIVAFSVVLVLNRLNTATQTRRNVDLPTSAPSPKSLSRAPQFQCCTVHAPERIRGYISFKLID